MEYWIPLVSAFAGALLGALTSVATVLVQSWREDRRHLRATAVQLALAEFTFHVDLAKAKGTGQSIAPISTYFAHHLSLLNRASKGSLSADDMIALSKESKEITAVLRKAIEK